MIGLILIFIVGTVVFIAVQVWGGVQARKVERQVQQNPQSAREGVAKSSGPSGRNGPSESPDKEADHVD